MHKGTLLSVEPVAGFEGASADNSNLDLDDTGVEDDELPNDNLGAPSRPPVSARVSSGVATRVGEQYVPRVGSVIAGKYRVESVIEQDGSTVVLQAVHPGLDQFVTIKCLLPSPGVRAEAVGRFLRGARAAAQLTSEHAARILDIGRLRSGVAFVVTEELAGWEMDEVLRVRGPLPVQEAVEYVIQVCEVLAEAHSLGIVHGSLNLGSVVLTRRSDDSPSVKVLGFGGSVRDEIPLSDGSLSGASGFMTILPYLSPEQIRGATTVSEQADVWSLGALLHTLLAGVPPFRAKNALALLAVVSADAPRPLSEIRGDVAPALDATVLCCLEKDPSRRFGSVAELAVALRPFAPGDAQGSVERMLRNPGRVTRPPAYPPPYPSQHPSERPSERPSRAAQAIVPVPRRESTRPEPKAEPPTVALTQKAASGWLLAAALIGAAMGVLGALAVGYTAFARLENRLSENAAARPLPPAAPVAAMPVAAAPAVPVVVPVAPAPVPATPAAVLPAAASPAAPVMSPAAPASTLALASSVVPVAPASFPLPQVGVAAVRAPSMQFSQPARAPVAAARVGKAGKSSSDDFSEPGTAKPSSARASGADLFADTK